MSEDHADKQQDRMDQIDLDQIEWEDIGDDADETCTLCPKEEADGLEKRFSVSGIYRGTKFIRGTFGISELYILRCKNDAGVVYNLGVWGFPQMSQAMSRVPLGCPVCLEWKGVKDVGKGNPMKMGWVRTPKGVKLKPPVVNRDDSVPF